MPRRALRLSLARPNGRQACRQRVPPPAPQARNKSASRARVPWEPGRRLRSTGLLELQDHAIGLTPDLGVEYQQAVIVGRVTQHVAASRQHEAGALEVSLDQLRVDAVEL